MQQDRQREIAAENRSLMHRLAGIMREDRENSVPKYSHLSVEYRESLRRKKLLKLEACTCATGSAVSMRTLWLLSEKTLTAIELTTSAGYSPQ